MHNQYVLPRITLLALLLLGFTWKSHAQQYVQSVVGTPANTTFPERAVDADDATAATLTPVVASVSGTTVTQAQSANLRLSFTPVGATTVTIIAGSYFYLLLQTNVLLANNSVTIKTYLGSADAETFPFSGSGVKIVSVNGTTKNRVGFPTTKAFDNIEVIIESPAVGVALTTIDLFRAYATLTPLPVELVAFQAKSTSAGTALAWSTASERNCDYFVVERADSSPENFRALGQVAGAGTTMQRTQYNFVDTRPAVLSYYRLRQIDRDGITSFSPVVFVKTAVSNLPLVVYPSPATETVVVTGAVGTRFALFDQLGRQLHTGEVLAGTRPTLDVRALPGGVYFVRDLATGSSRRFVKVAAE
jgi:hypothetical protein